MQAPGDDVVGGGNFAELVLSVYVVKRSKVMQYKSYVGRWTGKVQCKYHADLLYATVFYIPAPNLG